MKKFLPIIFLAAYFIFLPLTGVCSAETVMTRLGLTAGTRVDKLDWNIAGNINGTNPNILSELKWKDLEIYQVNAKGSVLFFEKIYMKGSVGYGRIFDGSNRDSDYAGDNRTLEFSRSDNSADNGDVFDASGGLGFVFRIPAKYVIINIIPLGGYSYSEQNLTITNGFQTIPATGSFTGLDSTYDTQWKGPWAGGEISFDFGGVSFISTFEYHWVDYYAVADWNLRPTFQHPKSFEHEADGTGIVVSVGWNYDFSPRWSIHADINYQDWTTDNGIDRTFFTSGAITETRLNEVNWESASFMAGISFRMGTKKSSAPAKR